MAITPCIPTQAKADFLGGVHAPGDTYKMALFTDAATLGPTSSTYSSTGEVPTGGNYVQGGEVLTGHSAGMAGTGGRLTFSSPQWLGATITARGAVIYNTSKSNKIIAILDFGSNVTSTNGNFTVGLPAIVDGGTLQFNEA